MQRKLTRIWELLAEKWAPILALSLCMMMCTTLLDHAPYILHADSYGSTSTRPSHLPSTCNPPASL
jgi:hypothetical protein